MGNLNEVAREWERLAAQLLAEELREGNHVHVITGDLKASFEARDNTVVSDIHYADTELQDRHPGQVLSAWLATEDDAVAALGELIEDDLTVEGVKIYYG